MVFRDAVGAGLAYAGADARATLARRRIVRCRARGTQAAVDPVSSFGTQCAFLIHKVFLLEIHFLARCARCAFACKAGITLAVLPSEVVKYFDLGLIAVNQACRSGSVSRMQRRV
jgi:hypothetical protein